MKKLIVIDGNSLLFRAYYATAYGGMDIMKTTTGIPTNAIYVFSNMIAGILKQVDPGDGIAVAFDTGAKTFRHEQLETYKGQRKETPEDLITQMPLARDFLAALNIPVFELDGYEADDVAGTLAFKAAQTNIEAHLFTSDKDFLQLVNGKVKIQIIKKGLSDIRLMDKAAVYAELGIYPEQVPDFKGLCGDQSDNLPGVPGIGPKTAAKLLSEYKTLENIFASVDNIPGKVGENLRQYADTARQSKQLATILLDVPLDIHLHDLTYPGFNLETIALFSKTYELRSLLGKLPPKFKREIPRSNLFEFQIVKNFPQDIKNIQTIGIAVNMLGTNYWREPIEGYAISINGHNFYLNRSDFLADKYLHSLLNSQNIKIFTYDYKRVKIALYRDNLTLNPVSFDALLASYLLDVDINFSPLEMFALYNDDLHYQVTLKLTLEEQIEVSSQIAHYSLVSSQKMLNLLHEKDLSSILLNIEQPLTEVLVKMEIEGLPLDVNLLNEFGATFNLKKNQLTEEIYALVGGEFNISSPKQVADVLFEKLQLPRINKDSTSIDVLKYLLDKHPVVAKIVEYRKYSKMLSTYIESISQHIFPDHKLHAIFNQAITSTGRLSSSEPNLQNIAVKDEESRQIRQAFYYSDPHLKLVSLDYSQIELRILASLSNCQKLIDIFNENRDIHDETAEKIFNNHSSQARRMAKAVNFGIIYGISDWGLSEQIGTSPTESRKIITKFFEHYPEVKLYMDNVVENLKQNEYVSTLTGRRRYLKEIHSTNYQTREFAKRAAMNAPIQGTAADLIKLAMIKIEEMIVKNHYETRLILQIHDELIFKVPENEFSEIVPKIKKIMENALPLKVKLSAEVTSGKSWYDL